MNVKKFLYSILVCVLVFGIGFGINACKKDESPAGPGPGGGTPYGSGTTSMSVTGAETANLSFSGNGTWPPGADGVAAAVGNSGKSLEIVGYHRTSTGKTTGAHYNFIVIAIHDTAALAAGKTYTNASVIIGINIDTTYIDSLAYFGTSGSITLTTVTSTGAFPKSAGSHIVATFSGTASKTGGGTITISGGTFDVNAAVGSFLGGGDGGSGNPFDFPIPDIPNLGGIVGIAGTVTTLPPPLPPQIFATGFAGFYGGGTTLVDGGTVTVGTTNLTKQTSGGNILYFGAPVSGASFDGTTTTSYNVTGNGSSVAAFSGNIAAPPPSVMTSPAANATISRSSNLTVQWDGTGGSDSIQIIIGSTAGGLPVIIGGLSNSGSYTIPSARLSGLTAGSGYLTLAKYRYVIQIAGGKNYAIVAETVHYLFGLTLN